MATPKTDLFAYPHQEQRNILFKVSTGLSAREKIKAGNFGRLVDELQNVIDWIKNHANYEDMFISTFLQDKGLQKENWLEREHVELHQQLSGIESLITKIRTLDAEQQISYCSQLYPDVNRFIGSYLLHMDREEQEIMPLLWQHCTAEEIMGILVAFLAYQEPDIAKVEVPSLLKNMTFEEKSKMFASIKEHAPTAAYQASLCFESTGDDTKISRV